jgi:hypothetical protein
MTQIASRPSQEVKQDGAIWVILEQQSIGACGFREAPLLL